MTTVLQFSLYGLVVLASVMLAFAEGATFPDAVTIPLAILALFVTDRWKLFCLSTRRANCLGLSAFGIAIWEISSGDIESRLLSFAHLLVYLTWILLFMEKSPRMYWTMCAMALLHVALGAVLTSSGFFGALLALFLVGEIWTLTVFTLHRARQKYSPANSSTTETEGEIAIALVGRAVPVDGFVWNRRSRPVSTIQLDPNLRWISWPFVSGVGVTVLLSAILGCLFFLFTPRIWVGNFSAFGDEADTALQALKTGFSEEVRLGDIGQILESTVPVLEMRLFDHATGQPISAAAYAQQLGLDEPLFRGAVLGEYANGKWRGTTSKQDTVRATSPTAPFPEVIRQEILLDPTDTDILFAMPPYLACRLESKQAQVLERRLTSVLYRDSSVSNRESVKYVVYSEKPPPGGVRLNARGTLGSWMYRSERDYYCAMPDTGLERLQAFAKEIAQTGNNPDVTPLEIARRMESRLRNSGEFGYTLDLSVQDSAIDAVEDFLFNRKQGHCEYFASALVLMLRSVDIPARMVSGFKGGDLNESTGYFVVQQRHAHVWVEAYLDRQWVILDGTPASREESVNSLAPKDTLARNVMRFFAEVWSHHVLGMSMTEQDTNVYTPLKEMATSLLESVDDEIEELKEGGFSISQMLTSPLLGSLIAAVSCGLLAWLWFRQRSDTPKPPAWGVWNQVRKLFGWILPQESIARAGNDWRSRLSQIWVSLMTRLRGEATPQRLRVEFYERFLQMLRSAGLEPLPSQTAHEFITGLQPRWQAQLAEVAVLPPTIVAQFYRVRFGGESLSVDELRQLNRQLDQWEEQWRRRDRKS